MGTVFGSPSIHADPQTIRWRQVRLTARCSPKTSPASVSITTSGSIPSISFDHSASADGYRPCRNVAFNTLNERGLRTGAGNPFDSDRVHWVRFRHQLKSLRQRLLDDGWLTGKQVEAKLGAKRTTLSRWRTTGRIHARICSDLGEWLYWLPPGTPDRATSGTPTREGSSTAGGAV